jgi:hypothetical protein
MYDGHINFGFFSIRYRNPHREFIRDKHLLFVESISNEEKNICNIETFAMFVFFS